MRMMKEIEVGERTRTQVSVKIEMKVMPLLVQLIEIKSLAMNLK